MLIIHDPIVLNSTFVPSLISELSCYSSSRSPRFLCLSSRTEMDIDVLGPTLYPLDRCKILHLIRSAQGFHNAEGEDYEKYKSGDLSDASLTLLGWQQVHELRELVKARGLFKRIELVIVSPLSRTMQTAVGVFGGEIYTNDVPPLMNENVGEGDRPRISSLNAPPIIASELCREHMGIHPSDKRSSITEYRRMFPAIDFSSITNDEDVWWKPNARETDKEVTDRGLEFLDWLWTRKEKEIAIWR